MVQMGPSLPQPTGQRISWDEPDSCSKGAPLLCYSQAHVGTRTKTQRRFGVIEGSLWETGTNRLRASCLSRDHNPITYFPWTSAQYHRLPQGLEKRSAWITLITVRCGSGCIGWPCSGALVPVDSISISSPYPSVHLLSLHPSILPLLSPFELRHKPVDPPQQFNKIKAQT